METDFNTEQALHHFLAEEEYLISKLKEQRRLLFHVISFHVILKDKKDHLYSSLMKNLINANFKKEIGQYKKAVKQTRNK